MPDMQAEKNRASAWFTELRNQIVEAFEALEREDVVPALADREPGRFELRETKRENGGGGLMSVMRGGRVFEKVGVNISTVFGELSPQAAEAMADKIGLGDDRRFWASGISLVAHMQNPRTPAVHMNTRMFWTPERYWFGGGADLNPCLPRDEDTADFHADLKAACDAHDPAYYERFRDWADEYFYIPHRKRARGVGGIFFDDLNTGDWEADFAFTQAAGRAFLPAFLPVTRRHMGEVWSAEDKQAQLEHRGIYAEYNLLYDRGTKFGLSTGHDPEAVLMSMPPEAKWV
ncbi:MAG: oxygen-dependent coproporphyrinogen oxidase [Rhodobacterales bacterium]|nr:MAG: oxygen-dependent coproporphyrinogen oxidase [Rhodobacterales bacterium]